MSTIRFHLRGSRALINGSLAVQNDGVARTVRVRVAVLAMLMLRSC
jgi:hypothetical protein